MPDIWCSFNAFVDYDVHLDENIGDKQAGDQTFWETNAYIMTVQKCKLCFPQTGANRERESETDRQTKTQKKDRQKNRDREKHEK